MPLNRREFIASAGILFLTRRLPSNPPSAAVQAVPAGQILPYIPTGCIPCDGRLLSREQYPELYRIIGIKYGKARFGRFRVPDLRGRVVGAVSPMNQASMKTIGFGITPGKTKL